MVQISPDDLKIIQYTDELIAEMPSFVRDFRIDKSKQGTSFRTIHQYLHRYKVFFNWLLQEGIIVAASPKVYTRISCATLFQ